MFYARFDGKLFSLQSQQWFGDTIRIYKELWNAEIHEELRCERESCLSNSSPIKTGLPLFLVVAH